MLVSEKKLIHKPDTWCSVHQVNILSQASRPPRILATLLLQHPTRSSSSRRATSFTCQASCSGQELAWHSRQQKWLGNRGQKEKCPAEAAGDQRDRLADLTQNYKRRPLKHPSHRKSTPSFRARLTFAVLTPVSGFKGLAHLLTLDELLKPCEPHSSEMDSADDLGPTRIHMFIRWLSTLPHIYIWGVNQQTPLREVIFSGRKRTYL